MKIGSAPQHPIEGNGHGVTEVMLGKELQIWSRSLRWVKKTTNVGYDIRNRLDAGMESTGYVLETQL